jgi:DNA-binding MarR family transcriptional regulator
MSDETAEALGADLRSAIARIYSRFRSERAAGEIGDAALGTLSTLQKRGPMTLTELSERAHVTAGSMSQTVNRLDALGYAVRSRDPGDGRRVLFTATEEGAAVARAARARRESWFDAQLAALTPEERTLLAHASRIISTIADS